MQVVQSEYLQQVLDEVPRESPDEIAQYFDRLWPLMRSITGDGVRKTHEIIREICPLNTIEIPSGTQVFDWTVPKEWVVREAYVNSPNGERIVDVRDNTLHLMNYSVPFRGKISLTELSEHLYSLPDLPEAIPYVTSYYAPSWGFCMQQQLRDQLEEGEYEVVIDSDHVNGAMTLSEAVLPGDTSDEVLISTYTCHPSMANNELSGPLVASFLCRRVASMPRRRLTYRFVFVPETIGSIAYLKLHGEHLKKHLVAGYVVSCVGDAAPFTYKKSRLSTALADRAAELTLTTFSGDSLRVLEFWPGGSDERQYCAPGFNLPVGVIARSIYGSYREYHTSLDNRDFCSFEKLVESVDAYYAVLSLLERNVTYERLMPYGEPHLTKYGLHSTVGASREKKPFHNALQWFLNLADGDHDLLSIAERSRVDFWLLAEVAQQCLTAGLVQEKNASSRL